MSASRSTPVLRSSGASSVIAGALGALLLAGAGSTLGEGARGVRRARRLPQGGGGHFAAWEQPELFTAELRAAFRPLRTTATHVAGP